MQSSKIEAKSADKKLPVKKKTRLVTVKIRDVQILTVW